MLSQVQDPNFFSANTRIVKSGLELDDVGLLFCSRRLHLRSDQTGLLTEGGDLLVTAVLSAGYATPIGPRSLARIHAADQHWKKGDKAIANFALLFAGFDYLTKSEDRKRVDETLHLHEKHYSFDSIFHRFDEAEHQEWLIKYDADQPRVPAGNGQESVRWTAIWNRVKDWLSQPVAEYDTDTGTQVGVRPRWQGIATKSSCCRDCRYCCAEWRRGSSSGVRGKCLRRSHAARPGSSNESS